MGRLRLYLITALAFLLEVLVLLWFPVAGVRPRVLPPLVCLVVIFHKASSLWGKWLTCLAALAGLEVLLVLGHCLAGASVFAGLRIAGPELLLSAACFPLAVLLTRLKGHPRRKRKGW